MPKHMLKGVLVFVLVFLGLMSVNAQEKYIDKNGIIIFEASEKLFEEVKATNETVTTIFDAQTNEIASLALVKAFRFKNALMQEHFNENYAESDSYPKAIFKGKLVNFKLEELQSENSQVDLKGKLSFHGKDKEIETVVTVQRAGDKLAILGDFIVTPADFDIKIPKIVRNKIAKEVQVKIDFKLAKK